ncbi:MAG: HD domain-containing protein [Ruminiclostridium sp.]|nr:HD domain-containing protein [Ruminiclostridium sp.]
MNKLAYIRRFSTFFAALAIVFNMLSTVASAEDYPTNASGVPNRAVSVDPTGVSEGFSAVLYDNTNGLPTSEANAIAETSDGFLWIGSYAGLIRYDGSTFERMDPSGGLTSIKCLFVDSKDRLWIGTNDNGVAVMERGELRTWGKLDGMRSAHTRAITEDRSGNIYIATSGGITVIDTDYNLKSLDADVLAEANMRDIRTGCDGTIYGTTDAGDIALIRGGVLINFVSVEENPLGRVGTILPDPNNAGKIYMESGDFGLYYAQVGDDLKVIEQFDIEPLKYIKGMEYIDGKLWICATNGIGSLENGKFHLAESLPMDNNVGHVMTDYLGNLWFTSTRQGVMKVVPNQFADLFARYELTEAVVNSTCYSEGKLFVATDTGLIVLDDNGIVTSLPLTKAVTASGADLGTADLIEYLTGSRIRSIIKDSLGRLWFSTWRANGLLRYDHGSLTAFTADDGLLSGDLRAVSEGKDGRILVALTGGVNVIEGDKVTVSYGRDDGIVNTESLTVAEGLNGEIILGSNGRGIYVIDGSGVRNIDVEQGLPSDIVMRLRRDEKNNVIWIVTSSAIAYMTPDYKITKIKNFPYPNNFDMYENSKEDMWILSSNGIYVIPTEKLLANGDIEPVFYSIANGLPCITTANSYSELTENGDLYIAGTTGIAKVNIEKSFEEISGLKAAVPYIEADGKRIYPDDAGVFTVTCDTQKITIPSFVFSYAMTDPQVSYLLEGFDRQSVTMSRSDLAPVDYTNLHGGSYRFVLSIKDAMGRGNKEIAVSIVKERAYYEQWWFYLICGVLAVLLIGLLILFILHRKTVAFRKKEKMQRRLFHQTATALVNAIDAKDKYTHGHSSRVADYSRKLAEMSGKSEKECEDVYYAALLHDVGKIGIPGSIINKDGRLTDEEYTQIKLHPTKGVQILESITEFPYISVGAHYHHERYDGRGYPEGLKGDKIPEIARIIAVADSYDAMTSKRSYRDPIPQQRVREEIVKGSGTQFDPEYARLMLHLIDEDLEYKMSERSEAHDLGDSNELVIGEYRSKVSEGIFIDRFMTSITLSVMSDEEATGGHPVPAIVLFDSLDGKVHTDEKEIKDLNYFEYCEIRYDMNITAEGVRKISSKIKDEGIAEMRNGDYRIDAVRIKDHALIRVSGKRKTAEFIIALPDSTRFLYIGLTGEHCLFTDIVLSKAKDESPADYIPRIAEEISYINVPAGDIPNIQADGYRTAHSAGIKIKDGLTISLHTMSLPTARLVWHCPYIDLFCSADGTVGGKNYRDLVFVRFDGEFWVYDQSCSIEPDSVKNEDFKGWEAWKQYNKDGYDATVTFRVEGSRITIITENAGISMKHTAVLTDITDTVYASVTGDQVAVTNIRIN